MEQSDLEIEYAEWVKSLKVVHDPDYYENIIKYSSCITEELNNYKQHFMAKQLHMSPPRLSTLRPLLEVIAKQNNV